MCKLIATPTGEVYTVRQMHERGWTLTPDDVVGPDPDVQLANALDSQVCLCILRDVGDVLDRNGLDHIADPYGWTVDPDRYRPSFAA